jgi:phosphatidylinositol alpha-1,6-mannosyltransferase
MERLNWHMVDELARRASVQVVSPAGSANEIARNAVVCEVPLRPLPWFLLVALIKALKLALRCRPQVVLAGSGLTAPIAWLAARVCGAKAITYVHGLDVAVPNRVYRAFWLPTLRRVDQIVANSQATAKLAQEAGVEAAKIKIVHPGVDIPACLPNRETRDCLRVRKNWMKRPVLLSVGRLTSRKGLREFVTDVLPLVVLHKPDVLLVVVGEAPVHSLHAKVQSVESIRLAAREAGVERNLEFLGVIKDRDELGAVYEAADVHVFPVREVRGDPEGFGMVAIEAAAYGVPTVAYATGGVVDAVSNGVSGYLRNPGDSVGFAQAVLQLLDCPLPKDAVRAFSLRFDWQHFGSEISRILLEGRDEEQSE